MIIMSINLSKYVGIVAVLLSLFAMACVIHCQIPKANPQDSTLAEQWKGIIHKKLLHVAQTNNTPSSSCVRVCYYVLPLSNSSDYLQPEDVDAFLCTHLIIVADGSAIVNDSVQFKHPQDEELIQRTVALKQRNPRLLLLFSLMLGFPKLVTNHTAVVSFAYNMRMFVEQRGLDGVDVDWEFPKWSPGGGEKALFVDLLDHLSTALRLVQPSYLLTVAVSGIKTIVATSYDLPGIARNCDLICLMGYDYHMYKPYLPFTGHNAPLYPSKGSLGYFATLNVAASVAGLLRGGVPRQQLVVGVPTYGRTWRWVWYSRGLY
ncbi:chitotriosidase-1 [Hyalella azteca]|uniref:Chitotriosidase-1 n=1 Tax=Hyalella azteca TaxID=294128 RepID=A0A979FRG5_HYAAZ|nr:chitotriosidase-1 [Hyalella azteca]